MLFPPEIAHYGYWHIDEARFIGILCQFLGLMAFISLWWHQDRGWRVLRILFAVYFGLLGLTRYGLWIAYAAVSPFPGPLIRAFILRSGIAGLLICIAAIVLLIMDRKHRWVSFSHFGPENWNASSPSATQWLGLIAAVVAIWFPFLPNPLIAGWSIFTFGFPTSFGVTLAPVLLFLSGIFLAADRSSNPKPVACTSAGMIVSALLTDPMTLHGGIITLLGVLLMISAWCRSRINRC